ncbi:MAG: hypothetical protein K8F32_00695 [Rhodocyclaceae bacterium]|jgi:hypothetical protein|nr:hypothetical protein [Rhodocyclaceae bacterium]
MPLATDAANMGANGTRRDIGIGCGSFRVVWAPAAMPLRLKKMGKEKKKEGKRGAPESEGGRGLWPTNIAICIKRSPYVSCCLVR